ncbi:aldo/keto reductase [Aquitalea sp. USM4]|uniref:aldo/keto reductase n=1 Tax=Aquitalea sp. USM4 TaxID=1590041 RepID=UPI00103B2973|nr:aldo/keto reductase [Aquitalea sp. USM4]QBJ79907.1 aldo/keto reductase [Aquitalea sp. USM4]
MKQRQLGPFTVSAIGLGCMNLSHAYGVPPSAEQGGQVLLAALDAGVTLFDTAALYGFGANEELVGRVLKPHRQQIVLTSKCGMTGVEGKRVIDGRPDTLRQTCEDSLRRLQTDVIDLYYLHRWDRQVPIEDSVGALADLVAAGKIRSIGLSEVSAATLARAQAVHPIAAVQSEYSLWTRNPEIALLDACREQQVALVAFSPLGRGFLAGGVRDPSGFAANDIRRAMPRFQTEHFSRNLRLLDALQGLATETGFTLAQLAMGWLLAQSEQVIPIPGTSNVAHLQENLSADTVTLDMEVLTRLDAIVNENTVSGARYNAATQQEIDTEEFGVSVQPA